MSYNSNALNAYKDAKIVTASPGNLILMLYTRGIKEIKQAISKMNVTKIPASDIEAINNHILKAQDIITELMASLNMNEGGEIASNLLSIYTYFNQQLLEANLKKDYKPLVEVCSMMEELYNGWNHIVLSPSSIQSQPQFPNGSINIAG